MSLFEIEVQAPCGQGLGASAGPSSLSSPSLGQGAVAHRPIPALLLVPDPWSQKVILLVSLKGGNASGSPSTDPSFTGTAWGRAEVDSISL